MQTTAWRAQSAKASSGQLREFPVLLAVTVQEQGGDGKSNAAVHIDKAFVVLTLPFL